MAGTKTVDKPVKATATVEDEKTEPETDDVVKITELEAFEPSRVDGVKAGANGFPILMLKSLPEQTEKADTPDDTHGSFTGTHTHGHDAHGDQGDDDTHSHSHSHSGDGDHSHSHAGKAAADATDDWKQVAALVKQLGDLLAANTAKTDATTQDATDVAEGTETVETEPSNTGDDNLNKAVAAAVTEATKASTERVAALEAQLAKVLALPIPGGPVTSTPAVRPKSADGTDWAAKAIEYRDMASRMTNPADADAFRILAAQAAEKAAELSA